jgi:hypothetical protein
MFLALGHGVHVAQRQPRFVNEVSLEQSMCAHDLQRETFAILGQPKTLTLSREETLPLHAADQRHDVRAGHPQCAAKRTQGRTSAAVFLLREVLQRVFDLVAEVPRAAGMPPLHQSDQCDSK